MFLIALAVNKETSNYSVAAVTWYKDIKPTFSTRKMTLPFIQKHFLSTVMINNPNLGVAINAVCNRTIETLLIKKHITTGHKLKIEIMVKPNLAKETFNFPIHVEKYHWRLTAAEDALDAWLRGE